MHASNSMKVLSLPQKSWDKNDPGGKNNQHNNNYSSRSHSTTPKSNYHSNHNAGKTHWTELEIKGAICNLSPTLWSFVHLTKLNLRDNNLTYLPSDISKLVNLISLDLTSNRLQSIPAEIGSMVCLKELLLNNNCLKNLPFEIGKLFQLQKIGLKGNPLPNKYLNFCNDVGGTQKLISFLFDHLPTHFSALPERLWVPLDNCQSPKPAVFTVICYNVLCDKNCTRQLYGYCPQWALNWNYRKKTIMSEIRRYQADIICLQEVETDQFYNFFLPELKKDNYTGVFSPKSRARTMQEAERKHVDGCAIFYKQNKFRAIKDYLIEFNQVAIEAAEGSHEMINRVMTKDNIGLALLLETTKNCWPHGLPADSSSSTSGQIQPNQPLLISTCHVHWDPEFCDVKLIQTMMLIHKLQNIIKISIKELRPDLNKDFIHCDSIPLILCGDFNSLPESGVVEFLKSGRVGSNHKDFKDIVYKECLKKIGQMGVEDTFHHPLKLSHAYQTNQMPYTNFTYEFKGIIDYIFHSKDSLRCLGVLGSPDITWFDENKVHGCPHPQIPSDHLLLLAQFELKNSPLTPYSSPFSGSGLPPSSSSSSPSSSSLSLSSSSINSQINS